MLFIGAKNVCDVYAVLIGKNMETPGIEPGSFRMQSGRATTALHPHLISVHATSSSYHTNPNTTIPYTHRQIPKDHIFGGFRSDSPPPWTIMMRWITTELYNL